MSRQYELLYDGGLSGSYSHKEFQSKLAGNHKRRKEGQEENWVAKIYRVGSSQLKGMPMGVKCVQRTKSKGKRLGGEQKGT